MLRFLAEMMIILAAITAVAVVGVGCILFWWWLSCIHPLLALTVFVLTVILGMA